VKCLLGDERMQRIVPNMIGLNVYLAAKSIDCIVTADEHDPDDDEIKIAGLAYALYEEHLGSGAY